jgi:hypothetical protein
MIYRHGFLQLWGPEMRQASIVSWRQCAMILVVGAAGVLQSQQSVADGALAVGIPPGGTVKGFAAGHSVNAPDMQKARELALDSCHTSTGASDAAKKACSVVATFKDQCGATALDPKDGTPGAGWGIAENQQLADSQALQQCRNTAGANRQQFCVIPATNHYCDGSAK